MRIDGGWYLFDDDVTRPVILGEILAKDGTWIQTLFLVDTGADRTVFNAAVCTKLGFDSNDPREYLGGLGGLTESIDFETQIRLTRDGGGKPIFRGNYAGVIKEGALDFSILGRDVLDLFSVIIDQPQQIVTLLTQRHRYEIIQD
jgi:Retroviral aspartyl protease